MSFKQAAQITVAALLLFLLFPQSSSASSVSCSAPAAAKKTYINVAVATLWKEAGAKRTIDQPALSNPVDIKAWTSKMATVKDRLWLTGKAETQALYGQEVTVLQTSGSWAKAAVKDQSTSKNKSGYPGWLPKAQLVSQAASYEKCPVASVSSKTAVLFENRQKAFMEVSFNTRLPIVYSETTWVQVATPAHGLKWLKKSDVIIHKAGAAPLKPSGADLLKTGKQFVGLPYLWAGTSSYGFDCSGFTYSVYRYYGISIPRDASEQFLKGTSVAKSKLQPGDLLFFAYNRGKGKVHHVAMYAGNGKMIHAPKAGRRVEIISMNTAPYKNEFAGARRYVR